MVGVSEVDFGQDLCLLEWSKGCIDQWEWALVLDRYFIEPTGKVCRLSFYKKIPCEEGGMINPEASDSLMQFSMALCSFLERW